MECDHVVSANEMFNFAEHLRASINCDFNGEIMSPACSPPTSPPSSDRMDDLLDLSPLTSPEPTPPPSPIVGPSTSTQTPLPVADPITISTLPLLDDSSLKPQSESSTSPVSDKKPAHRKARIRAAQLAWRRNRRQQLKESVTSHYEGRHCAHEKYVASAPSISSSWDTSKATVAGTGYVGLDDGSGSQKSYKLEEMVGEDSKFKFKLVKWDGKTPTALLDASKRVVGVLAGHPNDTNWPLLQKQAADALESRRHRCYVPKTHRKHRRGRFPALRCGVSHGGGQQAPGNLRNVSPNTEILDELNALEPFQRIAGFASSVMATWAPLLHTYYSEAIDQLHVNDPSLKRIFPSSVFSAVSYNFGPRTVCFKHKDYANLPFGWCAVTALGYFNPIASGHLILWEMKMVIEFPPGATILLPSAIVSHANVLLQPEEKRYSFAQYSAGGIFRWIKNGFTTTEKHRSSLNQEERERDDAANVARYEHGLSLFPTYPLPKKKRSS